MEGRSLRLAPPALALALCLAGCGGTSAAEYEQRAATICHDATAPLREPVEGQDFGDLRRLAPEAGDRYRRALRELADLEPPEERRSQHERLVAAGRHLQASYGRLAGAVNSVDEEAALAALSRSKRDRLAVDRSARSLGLRVCAEGVETVADAVLIPVYRLKLETLTTAVQVARGFQRRRDYGTAEYSGAGLIDRVEELARLEPPSSAAGVHDRMVRALSEYGQDLVVRRGRGDPGPTLRRIREVREQLARPRSAGDPS